MLKKLFAFLIVLGSIFLCFGCASTTFQVAYLADGSIEQSFSVAYDEEILQENGYSLSDSVLKLREIFNSYWSNKCSVWQSSLNNNTALSITQKQNIMNSISHRIELNNNVMKFTIKYDDPAYISIVNNDGTEEETETKSKQEKHLFFTKVILQEGFNAYYGYEESLLYSELKEFYSQGTGTLDETDVNFTQVLSFTQRRIHSNADRIVEQNGTFYHIWNVDSENATAKVELYRIYASPILWYVAILTITLIFVIVSVVIAKTKKKSAIKVVELKANQTTTK